MPIIDGYNEDNVSILGNTPLSEPDILYNSLCLNQFPYLFVIINPYGIRLFTYLCYDEDEGKRTQHCVYSHQYTWEEIDENTIFRFFYEIKPTMQQYYPNIRNLFLSEVTRKVSVDYDQVVDRYEQVLSQLGSGAIALDNAKKLVFREKIVIPSPFTKDNLEPLFRGFDLISSIFVLLRQNNIRNEYHIIISPDFSEYFGIGNIKIHYDISFPRNPPSLKEEEKKGIPWNIVLSQEVRYRRYLLNLLNTQKNIQREDVIQYCLKKNIFIDDIFYGFIADMMQENKKMKTFDTRCQILDEKNFYTAGTEATYRLMMKSIVHRIFLLDKPHGKRDFISFMIQMKEFKSTDKKTAFSILIEECLAIITFLSEINQEERKWYTQVKNLIESKTLPKKNIRSILSSIIPLKKSNK